MNSSNAIISDPILVFAVLSGVAAIVYTLSAIQAFTGLFKIIPPVVWMYFVPMILTSLGFIPPESSLYGGMARYLLPMALILITVTINFRELARVGQTALIMFVAGTFGIALGVILSLLVFGSLLPPDGWQSLSMLSATWIGGSANMLAVHQSLNGDPSLFGPVVVVDTVIGYGWLGILIAMSAYQARFDRLLKADRTRLDEIIVSHTNGGESRKPAHVREIMVMLGGAFSIATICRTISEWLPEIGEPVIVSASTWTVIMVVTLGILLSITPLRKFEKVGAADFGYVALFLLLTSVGAQADFRAILEAPYMLLAGMLVMIVHILSLLGVAYLLRVPCFFIATGSMANIGGAVSAPVAAAAYVPALAPLGALLGVAGYIVGIYLPILISGILAAMVGL